MYHEGSRALQDQFDTRRLANRIQERKITDTFDNDQIEFIAAMDMFLLATADADGRPTCSYRGGLPGFVRVVDERTLAFPNYDGNGMFLSTGNVLANPHVGLLFIDFERQRRMRVNGVARIEEDDPLLAEYPEAQLVVRVEAREIFPNCARYVHKRALVERSTFVPRAACQTPAAPWKSSEWAADALPAREQPATIKRE